MKPDSPIRHSNVCPAALAHLDAAYRATTYVVHLPPGDVALRVNAGSPVLDEWLSERGHATWTFVTACNPGSRPLAQDENAARQAQLKQTVATMGYVSVPATGVPGDANWDPEPSLFIPGIALAEAAGLGARFGQNAILWGTPGGSAQLLYLCRD